MVDKADNNQSVNWDYTSEAGATVDESNFHGSTGVPLKKLTPVQWTASEYIAHEKSSSWYFVFFGSMAVLIVVVYLTTKDILASLVVLLAGVIMGVYAGRQPTAKQYEVSESGVSIDNRIYPYRLFKSFSIVEEGAIDSIWLKPLKRLSPVLAMYYSPEDEQKIIDVLSNFLPHEQRELDSIDRISKRMRF